MREQMSVTATLPEDGSAGALAGRIWRPDINGPAIVSVREDGVYDITGHATTMSALADAENVLWITQDSNAERVGELADILANTPAADRDPSQPWLLSPIDLQAVKAADATFAVPILEQAITKLAETAPDQAAALRAHILELFGEKLRDLVPGSAKARDLQQTLSEQGIGSFALEACLGEDALIFTKAQPMSTVGHGMEAGLHSGLPLNHSKPEVVLIASSSGLIVGATLGNDVGQYDLTDRSALLLAQAKTNKASATIGPFIRFFDNFFSLDTVQRMDITVDISADDGFELSETFSLSDMTRDMKTLVNDALGKPSQYPDGAVLYLGTGFAPEEDRDAQGAGAAHKPGDIVTVSTPALGSLSNLMVACDQAEPWVFGIRALMRNMGERRLLDAS